MQKYDAILVLGYLLQEDGLPTEELEARIRETAAAYHQGTAPVVLASGGKTEGMQVSEAEAIQRGLVSLGVPEKAIFLEDQSGNTAENIRNTLKLAETLSLHRFLIITSDYHVLRTRMTAARYGMHACFQKVSLPHDREWKRKWLSEWFYILDLLLGWQDEGKSHPEWAEKAFMMIMGKEESKG